VILADANVLVYAHREECERHEEYRAWLEGVLSGGSAYGVSDIVLSGCLRILTHPRIFAPPDTGTPGPRVHPAGARAPARRRHLAGAEALGRVSRPVSEDRRPRQPRG